ncbi:hypothetical protein PVK06_008219 [Gossypium arboreum]|uniref:RNase H type-1 domain-containing protein n=1 Tax=Gossypium arboreum TaxID=29729 RepID=A0ABR0QJD9_GOSAR|nr:hypothetical protein PVK06_008219 [Gossypium arboreum]
MAEYKGIRVKMTLSHTMHNQRNVEDLPIVKIQFDATFNNREFRSASGLVVRGSMNEYLASKSTIHRNIASPFAQKHMQEILKKKPCFQKIEFKHIQKTKNTRAHNTANEALQNSERNYLENKEPIHHDMSAAEQWARNPD